MNRNWQCLRGPAGGEDAHRLAAALAEIADAEFIERVLQGKAALDAFGGELRIGAYREKLDDRGNRAGGDTPGTYETLAYLFAYNHHNKATAGPTEPNAKPDNPPPLPKELTDEEIAQHFPEPDETSEEEGVPAPEFMAEEPAHG